MAAKRPHTREFTQDRRDQLGLAIQRAREAAGHPFRPSFAEQAGAGLSLRSLVKLEQGDPVGASVYEAAARTLGNYFEDWNEDTPRAILEDELVPANVRRRDDAQAAEVEPSDAIRQLDPDLADFLRPVIRQLRRQGMPDEAIRGAIDRVAEEIMQGKFDTERKDSDTPRGQVT